MKPQHVARARKLVTKKWYLRYRSRKNTSLAYDYIAKMLSKDRIGKDNSSLRETILRYAAKATYYQKLLNPKSGPKEAAQ